DDDDDDDDDDDEGNEDQNDAEGNVFVLLKTRLFVYLFMLLTVISHYNTSKNDSIAIKRENEAIKQSSMEEKSIGYDILISKTIPEVINNDDDDDDEENEMASTTITSARNDQDGKSPSTTSSLHKLCHMFQDMIDQLKKAEIRDLKTILTEHNEVKKTFLHSSSFHIDDDDQEPTIIEQSHLRKPTTIKQQRISRTVSIVLRVYHRSGTRGHRIGCVRHYRIQSTNLKRFMRKTEKVAKKRMIQSTKNIVPTSIVEHSENRTERSRSTGDALIHPSGSKPPLCRLTNNRSHSLTLNDQMEQVNEDNRVEVEQKDSDNDSTGDDNLVENNHHLNKQLPSRSSWRRKNFYKRRESLDEYLQRKVFRIEPSNEQSPLIMMDNNRILKFQSNNPWLNYIKTCGQKITWESLTTEQILMYESMFELIITEKSYLVVCNCDCNL
ncbi:hypothetical protein BLA29_004974, partial [Euroglyphus maynei]